MRVATKTIYDAMKYRLGNLTSDLSDANEIVATGNRLNNLSDDPIALTQVLSLKTTINNIEQTDKNIEVGKNWLTGVETSLTSVNDLILDAQLKANQMINASASETEREDMIAHIDSLLEQILLLGNTQVGGSYIFSGSKTDLAALEFDDEDDPTTVIYNGDDTLFSIKSESTTTISVGQNAETVFWEHEIVVDSTNNQIVFSEDPGLGENYEKVITTTIAEGTYDEEGLAIAIRNAMNEASEESGYGVTYDVAYDEETEKYTIRDDGTYSGYMSFQMMWETGYQARVSNITSGGRVDLDDVHLSVDNYDALTIETTDPIRVEWNGENWQLSNDPGYETLLTNVGMDPSVIEIDLTGDEQADITINLDNPATAAGDYIEFEIFTEVTDASIADDIGFYGGDSLFIPIASDTEAPSIYETVTIDYNNNKIDFTEIDEYGVVTDLTATIPVGDYTPEDLAAAIETVMEAESSAGNNVDYQITYDSETSTFEIKEVGTTLNELHLNWTSGTNGLIGTSTGSTVGFVNVDGASGSLGGDLIGSLGWDVGDTVSLQISDGVNTLDYSYTVTAADDNSTILNDLQSQLETTFGDDATFTVNGNMIEFDLASSTRSLTVSNLSDTGLNDASLDLSIGNVTGSFGGSLVNNGWDVGDTIDITFSTDGGATVFNYTHTVLEGEDTADILTDLQTQLAASLLGAVATFTVNDDVIEYEMAGNRVLEISDITDDDGSGLGVAANMERVDNSGTLLSAPNTNSPLAPGEVACFYPTPGDSVLSFPVSDNEVVLFTINNSNNKINFEEFHTVNGASGELTITIPNGEYTDPDELAYQIELAMEAASAATVPPNNVEYEVYYDTATRQFTIQEDPASAGYPALDEMHIYWSTGTDAEDNAADVLGYDKSALSSGSFGGDLLATGWDDGDIVDITITDGVNTLNYVHQVDIAGGDTTDSILTDLHTQLESVFGENASFTLDTVGNTIDFEMQNSRALSITNNGDGGLNDAALTLTGNIHSSSGLSTIVGGDTATLYSTDDDIEASSYTGDNEPILIVIDDSNNSIDFEEINADGIYSGALSITIPEGEYSDMDALAAAIEAEMEEVSSENGFSVDYEVSYNFETRKFTFKENGTTLDQLNMFWKSGENSLSSAAAVLGFDNVDDMNLLYDGSDEQVVNLTIDESNNKIDFKELVDGASQDEVSELTAEIPVGVYTDFDELAAAIEQAMEDASNNYGNGIDYSVTYDTVTQKYTIKENGTTLDELDILWETGTNASTSAADILGFNQDDANCSQTTSQEEVSWGIFDTLIAFKEYLLNDDVDGISRTLTRLQTHFDHIESIIADTGIKYNRLEIQEAVNTELSLTLTERRTVLEEADYIEAIMNLQSLELAYEASLSASSKIISLSLVDYL